MYNPKRLVAQGYDIIADRYTIWAQRVRAEERARYTQLLHETLPTHATVLELGCGAGLPTTRTLAQRGTFQNRAKVVDSLPGYTSGMAGCRYNLAP
jgi:hypothetical protein